MDLPRDLLLRFLLLYSTLYCSFGFSSPFLPAFLASRGVDSEWLGFLLGAGTAVRLISAPVAGRLADVFGAFRLELALFSISAAMASLLYLPTHSVGLLILVNLIQAAMLAPLAPLSDALALSWSRSTARNEFLMRSPPSRERGARCGCPRDEAGRVAMNIGKLPELMRKPWPSSGLDYRQPPGLTWP